MSSLKGAQCAIISGVGNTAQAVESKLTENEERNKKQEQVPTAMFTGLNKITQVLTQSREEEPHIGLVTIDRKLNGLQDGALTSVNALIRNHSEQDWN